MCQNTLETAAVVEEFFLDVLFLRVHRRNRAVWNKPYELKPQLSRRGLGLNLEPITKVSSDAYAVESQLI